MSEGRLLTLLAAVCGISLVLALSPIARDAQQVCFVLFVCTGVILIAAETPVERRRR